MCGWTFNGDVHAQGVGDFVEFGSTADDSMGESFDKVARMLKLSEHCPDYGSIHGGKAIEAIAKHATSSVPLPVSMSRIHVRKTCTRQLFEHTNERG